MPGGYPRPSWWPTVPDRIRVTNRKSDGTIETWELGNYVSSPTEPVFGDALMFQEYVNGIPKYLVIREGTDTIQPSGNYYKETIREVAHIVSIEWFTP